MVLINFIIINSKLKENFYKVFQNKNNEYLMLNTWL